MYQNGVKGLRYIGKSNNVSEWDKTSTIYMENLTMYQNGVKGLRFIRKSNNLSEWGKRSKICMKI